MDQVIMNFQQKMQIITEKMKVRYDNKNLIAISKTNTEKRRKKIEKRDIRV